MPFGRRVRECTFCKIYFCIGYMLLTFRGYMSVGVLGLGNVHFIISIFVLDICGQHLGDIYHCEQMYQRSQVSRIALRRCSQNVFLFVFVIVFVIFFGHVMSSHHSEQMYQRSQVSGIALRRCSQNVFVFVFVFVFVNFCWSCHIFSSL